MEEKDIRSLFEGAYAQTPTLPGNYLKYDDFRTCFNKLVEKYSDVPLDVEKLLQEYYPDAKYEPCYQPQDSGEVFKAFRIAPNKLKIANVLKQHIEEAFASVASDADGWIPFAAIGSKVAKEEYLKMGFIGIRQAVECLFRTRIEFRSGDPSKHEAPVKARDLKKVGLKSSIPPIATRVSSKTICLKQGSYIGESLSNFAYFPKPKDRPDILGWDAAINDLAVNLALEERWYYDEKDKLAKPILKNYLSYTFERLQYEDEEERKRAVEWKRIPQLKILTNENNAVWNTGLVDNIYDPIYAFFQKNNGKNPVVTQEWVFLGFGTANSYYQKIITDFPYKPDCAQYFDDPRELFYDINAQRPTLDWNHFIKENIERLPIGFVKKGATEGFPFIEDPLALPKPQRENYYKKLADAIFDDEDWKQFLTTRFSNALDIALSRVAWNYKTAIPVYYVKDHKMQLLLPLSLDRKGIIDVALVCNHKYDKRKGVNNYEGRTIFTMEMAYNNARLITRPDSDWLMADMCARK
ncbi:DUF3825 domain-containing protein [Bacteroides sp.]|uniref:DUF3825 domain-containing protein n=1 Tax=Bacteroides sp. TaxID=29523 RepID=UPI002A81AE19|nr:DUF3825 domain-containing protein [Bacteroides sp.]